MGGAQYGPQSDDGPLTIRIKDKMQKRVKKKSQRIDEHGKRGVSRWPFEFKHMSDAVKTCQIGVKKKKGQE